MIDTKKIRNSFDLFFKKLFKSRNFSIIISLIFAFAAWLIIMINRNPTREQTFNNISVSVSIDDTVASEMGLGIISDVSSQKFTVVVSGPNYIVSSLRASDFILTASVADVNAAGTFKLNVLPATNSSKTGYTFTSVTPSTIDVTFDYIDERTFTVVPKLVGVSAASGLIADTPAVSNSQQNTINIKGPRNVMNKISSVAAYAEVNKTLDSTQSFDTDLVLYDENDKIIYRYTSDGSILDSNGNKIENNYLNIEFSTIKVTQPILKKAVLNVEASFKNMPSGIAGAFAYAVDHTSATVIGTPDVIDGMKKIALSEINFFDISKAKNTFEVSAVLPTGVRLVDNIESFTVSIDTAGFAEKVFTITDIRPKGLASNLNSRTGSTIKNVKICGPASVIRTLSSNMLYAQIDLTDKVAGNYTVDAVIKSESLNNIWQVGTYSATVTVSEK